MLMYFSLFSSFVHIFLYGHLVCGSLPTATPLLFLYQPIQDLVLHSLPTVYTTANILLYSPEYSRALPPPLYPLCDLGKNPLL